MRYLVTGGNGYLGAALCRALIASGHRVRILDTRRGDLDCEYLRGDILSAATVNTAVNGVEGIFHVAAVVGFSKNKRPAQRRINVEGTRNVMAAALTQGIPKVVYTSTINTLGFVATENETGDEDTPYNWAPLDISYMETKYEAEQLVLRMVREQKLPATIVNPGTIFGGNGYSTIAFGQTSASPVPPMNANRYIELIRNGQMPTYPVGGTNCVALEDVVDGHIAAMTKGRIGERYVLGAENMTYHALFAFIAGELGVTAPLVPLIAGPTEFLARLAERGFEFLQKEPPFTAEMVRASSRFSFYSNAKAQRELGIRFRDFRTYLRDWIRKQG